jgi:hypothetical protein
MTATADSNKARAALDLRWQAHLVAEQLLSPDLSPQVSVAMLSRAYLDPIWLAAFNLTTARQQAENRTEAQSDVPGTAIFCSWCGSTTDLVDDGLMPLTGERIADPEWCCRDTDACVARRCERYPDAEVPAVLTAKLHDAMAAAAPSLLALSAVQAALRQAASQDRVLALTEPRFAAPSRPAPSTRAAVQASRWSHCISSPHNRRHLISRAR